MPQPKPYDRWIAIGGIVTALLLLILPKTPPIIIGVCVVSFILLCYPVWHFGWIEKSYLRRIVAELVLVGVLFAIGAYSWPQPVFSIQHQGAVVFPDFPQPLLYEYGTPKTFLAPVGLAINIEVINNRPTKTKVVQYFADIETSDGRWFRVPSLPMSPPHVIYFLNRRDITKGMRCNFDPAIFDSLAAEKALDSGESLEGWMFFEWPLELRKTSVSVRKVRLTLKNSQGETAEAVLESGISTAEEAGASALGGGVFCRGNENENKELDLSDISIKPMRN